MLLLTVVVEALEEALLNTQHFRCICRHLCDCRVMCGATFVTTLFHIVHSDYIHSLQMGPRDPQSEKDQLCFRLHNSTHIASICPFTTQLQISTL